MRARVAKYPPRTTFHTASEGEFSEVPERRGSGKLASPGTFIADSSALARVLVGWVYLLSSSYSLLQLLVGFTMAHPLLLPLFTGVRGRGILRTSPFGDSRKFAPRSSHLAYKDSPSGRCA